MPMSAEGGAHRWRTAFLAAWVLLLLAKLFIAWRLPLFVDEAFYWQEGQHLAWAYSDLPALTAWLTRLGVEIGGHHVFGVRWPFLLLGALLPWLVGKTAARWFGETAGWQAALLTTLMPLSATIGVLALPDVPMAFATALCLDAGGRLIKRASAGGALELALGLVMGALSHYRFLGVIAVGLIALLMLAEGRRLLRDPRIWIAIAIGVLAWLPLLIWNMDNGEAGLRFQLVDRHPWTFHADGINFVLVQAVLVTPLLFIALVQTFMLALRGGVPEAQWRYFGILGGVSTLGFFLLGFFADSERISFHWTLPGYLALMVAVPSIIRGWPRLLRWAMWAMLLIGVIATLGYYAIAGNGQLRKQFAAEKWYPSNFAGWKEVADATQETLATLPAGTVVVADSFKLGAELGFAMGDPNVRVLTHPLNVKHGREPQLALWGLLREKLPLADGRDALLVMGQDDVRLRELLAHYHQRCAMLGPLDPIRILNVDRGAQRFVMVHVQANARPGACRAPAMAYISPPEPNTRVAPVFEAGGWAIRDGVGLAKVEVLLDGQPVPTRYGLPDSGVAAYWRISTDPNHPNVKFHARVDASALPPGKHWLGLRMTGKDGVVEDWGEQPVFVEAANR